MKQKVVLYLDMPEGYRATGEYRLRHECEGYLHGPNGEKAGDFPVVILESVPTHEALVAEAMFRATQDIMFARALHKEDAYAMRMLGEWNEETFPYRSLSDSEIKVIWEKALSIVNTEGKTQCP